MNYNREEEKHALDLNQEHITAFPTVPLCGRPPPAIRYFARLFMQKRNYWQICNY